MDAEVHALPLAIARAEVLGFLGYPEGREPPASIGRLLEPALAEARQVARAQGLFVRLPIAEADTVGLAPLDAAGLVVGLVTAGGGIEERAQACLRRGEATQALLLDAAGSAAAEEAADRLGAIVAGEKGGAGPAAVPVSCRISPGFGRWPLEAQRQLFARLPHERVGVTLLPSLLMLPRKSISFAMWLGADARPITGLSGCARCRYEHCRYRRKTEA